MLVPNLAAEWHMMMTYIPLAGRAIRTEEVDTVNKTRKMKMITT